VKLPGATHPIVHCRTEEEAQEVRAAIAVRLKDCGLELHPEKTKIVYCKDDDRRRTYPNEKFDFLGYSVLQKCTGKEVAWPN
jgi:RNA-directed DNA polymerase